MPRITNKEEIIGFEKVISIYTEYASIRARISENDYICLGTYKTEERAKEVLYEIIENIGLFMRIHNLIVYEMPEE